MSHLFIERNEWVILDMEAGFEHLTRGTAESVDVLVVVIEPGLRSIQAAEKITRLAKQIGIPKTAYVLNKVHDDNERETVSQIMGQENILTAISFDRSAVTADLAGKSPFGECPAIAKYVAEIRQGLTAQRKSRPA